MKYFMIFLFLIGFVSSTFAYSGEELINGSSSFEILPPSIIPGVSYTFEIKFQYTAGPYALSNFSPVIEVSPASASSKVRVDVEPLEGISQGQVARIPVTITVDPSIEHEKIFLSAYFTGEHFLDSSDVLYKSAWTDSATIDIESTNKQSSITQEEKEIPSDYCDIDENITNSQTLLAKDPVVKEFLRHFPFAEFEAPTGIDESDPEQTHAIYRYGSLTLGLHILGYDEKDKTKCFVPIGYRLNAPYLPERVGLDYEKDPQVIIDLLNYIEPKFVKGGPQPLHDPYSDDERLQLAAEKKFEAEESMGGGSGIGFFDASNFGQSTIIIAILIGTGSGIGLTVYWKKLK